MHGQTSFGDLKFSRVTMGGEDTPHILLTTIDRHCEMERTAIGYRFKFKFPLLLPDPNISA